MQTASINKRRFGQNLSGMTVRRPTAVPGYPRIAHVSPPELF